MIHFFPIFSKDASASPFAQELKALGVPHRLYSDVVKLRYHSKLGMLLLGWPKLAWFALRCAVRSLVLSRPRPAAVVVGSDIEAIIFGIVRALCRSHRPQIILLGFILTARRSALSNRLRLRYFSFVMSFVDQVICHSPLEVERYRQLFNSSRTRFVYIPYGLHIGGREQAAVPPAAGAQPYILAAGRSGRDYRTLLEAVASLPIALHVVCDRQEALEGLALPSNVTVLRDCYDAAYVDQLKNAEFVVIPLSVADISAGQMVLIQSMAYAKATIITRSPTVEEYVSDGEQSLLVPMGDVAAMRQAIERLLGDRALTARLAANACATFDNKFCMKAYVGNLVRSLQPA